MAAPDLSVFGKVMSVKDFDRAEEEFMARKRAAAMEEQLNQAKIQEYTSGGSLPAAIQLANEIQKATAAGDTNRANLLFQSAKLLDKGVLPYGVGMQQMQSPQQQPGNMPDLIDQAVNEAGQTQPPQRNAPSQGQSYSPMVMPGYGGAVGSIAATKKGMETQAQKDVELLMNPLITGAEATAKAQVDAATDVNKKVVKAESMSGLAGRAIEILEGGKVTGSGAGAARDAALGFFGKSTEKMDNNSVLDLIAGNLTSNVPRMEGPQSDYDVLNYQKMAGDVGNRQKPTSVRIAAAKEIVRLNQKYAHLNGGAQNLTNEYQGQDPLGGTINDYVDVPKNNQSKNSGKVWTVKGDSDYNILPSGARFKGPDGKVRVKP